MDEPSEQPEGGGAGGSKSRMPLESRDLACACEFANLMEICDILTTGPVAPVAIAVH